MPISLDCNLYFGGPQGAQSWIMANCAEGHSSSTIDFIRVSQKHEKRVKKESEAVSYCMNYRQYPSSAIFYIYRHKTERMTTSLHLNLIAISVTLITEQVSCFISEFSHFSDPQKKKKAVKHNSILLHILH